MAATETVNNVPSDVESIVNRWVVDYYMFVAVEFFKNARYEDFCAIRDVLNSALLLPLDSTDVMPAKIRVLQFLSRINDGENLDLSFDFDLSVTPLESALILLENMREEGSVQQQDFESVSNVIKEMIVRIFIKNSEFEKAKEVLNKHFPRPMVGKKAIFMGLVRQKNNKHELVEQINFQRFKEEMLAFCQKLCSFSVPFLHKAAKNLIDNGFTVRNNIAVGCDEQDDEPHESGPSSSLQTNTSHQSVPHKHTFITKSRLEAVWKALAPGSDQKTITQLEEEAEREEQTRKDPSLHPSPTSKNSTHQDCFAEGGLCQRDPASPMEASPADQPQQTDAVPQTQGNTLSKKSSVLKKKRLYTPKLVDELDSKDSSEDTAASQELETEGRTVESTKLSNKTDQCPVTYIEVSRPVRKHPRRASKTSCRNSYSHQSSTMEEDVQGTCSSSKVPVQRPYKKQTTSSLSKDPGNEDISDSSSGSSPTRISPDPVPQKSSTPEKDSTQHKWLTSSKWRHLFNEAKESKETWSDEESDFNSTKDNRSNGSSILNVGHKKKKWTAKETQNLKEGVKRFGEGNWSKIKAYYHFTDRTNVNLKDRWRTMKKLNMV